MRIPRILLMIAALLMLLGITQVALADDGGNSDSAGKNRNPLVFKQVAGGYTVTSTNPAVFVDSVKLGFEAYGPYQACKVETPIGHQLGAGKSVQVRIIAMYKLEVQTTRSAPRVEETCLRNDHYPTYMVVRYAVVGGGLTLFAISEQKLIYYFQRE